MDGLLAQVARGHKAKQEAEASRKLDERYEKFIDECLKADGEPFNDENDDELQTWLDEVDELIISYRTHTALGQSVNCTHERLDDLYWLRDKFSRLLIKWQNQATSWLRDLEPVYFELSGKRKALLRAHLLLK